MFTIPSAACVAGVCSIYFGIVDWSMNYAGYSFHLKAPLATRISLDAVSLGDNILNPKARAAVRAIIGDKPVVCFGTYSGARSAALHGDCYFNSAPHKYASVTEEMHKRGF
jgi:hypothetical protein